MASRIRGHLRNNVYGLIAIFIVLGGTAYALETNTVRSRHIVDGQVKAADLGPPEAWREVAAGSTTADACADPNVTAVFCSDDLGGGMANRWQNFGGPWATAAFYKDQLGIVHLKGLVTSNGRYATAAPVFHAIFRLPAGYRPTTQRMFSSIGSGEDREVEGGRIDVSSNGLVELVQDCTANTASCSPNGGDVTLEGVSFRPDG